jgi:glucokinase
MPEPISKAEYVVGVDLGGTKILSGVFTASSLKFVGRSKMSTKAERGPEAVIERIAHCVQDAIDECDLNLKQVRGIGIGSPGSIDSENGKVIFAGNLGWKDLSLKKELEKKLEVPVFLHNDCNVCALGVHEVELEGKPKNMIGVFLGTGIGGGLILDGKLFTGFNRTAGEVGHMVLEIDGPKCTCGNRGCWEALSSRSALFRQVQEAVKGGEKTVLTEMLGNDLKDMRSGDLRKAIKQGDKLVEHIVEEAAKYSGIAIASLINILSPEVVVIGGGLMDALENEMLSIIVKNAREHAFPGTDKGVKILASKLGDDAGITGGAVLARRETR